MNVYFLCLSYLRRQILINQLFFPYIDRTSFHFQYRTMASSVSFATAWAGIPFSVVNLPYLCNAPQFHCTFTKASSFHVIRSRTYIIRSRTYNPCTCLDCFTVQKHDRSGWDTRKLLIEGFRTFCWWLWRWKTRWQVSTSFW